jgi:hypothetical protein
VEISFSVDRNFFGGSVVRLSIRVILFGHCEVDLKIIGLMLFIKSLRLLEYVTSDEERAWGNP